MNLFSLAWRNVWRNQRRSVVTIGAMTFALLAELLYAGLLPGFIEGMLEDVTALEVGDVQVHAPGYLQRPSLYTAIEDPDSLLRGLDAAGFPASARLLGGGLVAAGEFSAGVAFRGLDPVRDATVSQVGQKVEAGQWLDPADPDGVVIGRTLARTLSVEPGSELVALTQAADGSMGNALYHVRGILMSIAAGSDRTTVYMNEATFRDLLVFPKGAHQVMVRLPRGSDLAAGKSAIQALAQSPAGPLDVLTWRELMPMVSQMLDSSKATIYVVFLIVYIAVGILVLNAMLMAVFERIREFGVLKALGMGPLRVFSLIVVESGVQVVIASVLGCLLSLPGMWYLSTHGIDVGKLGGTDVMGLAMRPVWRGIYRPDVVAGPLVMLFVVVGAAIAYPALKAAWIQPIRAMTHR